MVGVAYVDVMEFICGMHNVTTPGLWQKRLLPFIFIFFAIGRLFFAIIIFAQLQISVHALNSHF